MRRIELGLSYGRDSPSGFQDCNSGVFKAPEKADSDKKSTQSEISAGGRVK